MRGDQGHTGRGEVDKPLYVEAFRGYRKFAMSDDAWLVGVTFPQRWRVDDNEAKCYTVEWVKGAVQSTTPLFSQLKNKGVGPGGHLRYDSNGDLVPRANMAYAKCPGIASNDHGCGFYARHGAHLAYDAGGSYGARIAGVVDLWGHIELGPQGIRAQYAKIVALMEYERSDYQENLLQTYYRQISQDTAPAMRSQHMLSIERLERGERLYPQIRKRYADVPWFATEAEMLHAFPVPDLTYMFEEEK